LPRVVAVGRLDINTEGLILLTNDGGLARVLELPATAWLRRYRVRAHGAIDQARLDALAEGVTIEGIHYAGIEARLEREQGSNVWIMMGLREGKNREIKRVLEHLGLSVNRLIRVSFGPFELGELAEGEVAEVRTRVLRDQLGAKLARQAGVNFDAGVVDRVAPPPPAPKRGERRWAGGRERPDRGGLQPRGAAQRSEPEPSQAPRKRKHVSALRAEIEKSASGPRKRIERSATSDRKGRQITVERIVATPEQLRRREVETVRRERARQRGAPRRPEREDRPSRSPRGESGTPDRRGRKPFEKRGASGEGRFPPRGEPKGKRPPRRP
jgi:23S rRNA pseudouridine2605 synthase